MRTFCICFALLIALTASCSAQKPLQASDVVGESTGESKCVGNNSFCHDEVVLYHVSAIKDDANKVHLAADKLVNSKWESMGDMDFTIDAAKATLTTEFPIPRTGGHGVLVFTVNGDKMDGVMTVFPENEVGRRMHVERKK
jgi:hypothetical protein